MVYKTKTFTITGAVVDYDVSANHRDLFPAYDPANGVNIGRALGVMIRTNQNITLKVNHTGDGSFPLEAGEVYVDDPSDIDKLYITTTVTTVINIRMKMA